MRRTIERVRLQVGRTIPVIVLDTQRVGPTVLVTANVHGDEVTGTVAVHRLDGVLNRELARGRVVLFPTLNPGGLEARSRVVPDDGADLNRLFPGDVEGGTSEHMAAQLWEVLLGWRPDALVDLHADSAIAIPYAICDRAVRLQGASRREMTAELVDLGRASGLTLLHEYPDEEYLRFSLDRSLAGAMVNHAGVPAITVESGPRRSVDGPSVQVTVDAVRRILVHLGLSEGALAADPSRVEGAVWRRTSGPRTRRAGVFVPALAPGVRFRGGALLGTVHGLEGEVVDELWAPAPGLVVSWIESGWVEARGVTGTLGLEEDGWRAR